MKKYLSLILGLLPLFASAQLVISNNYYLALSGGSQFNPTTVVLTNPSPSGIISSNGWIISENEFNQVQWYIGSSTGTYVVPFSYGASYSIPVSCNITSAGVGSGDIKFSTYHGSSWNNSTYEPSDVNTMRDFGRANYSNDAVDRFWILDAEGYSTKPTSEITFTYIRSGGASEIATPNYIVEASLIAQRFNSSLNQWDDWTGEISTDVTSANTGTVSSGNIPPSEFYRSWCIFNDSTVLSGIPSISNSSEINVFPNPASDIITINAPGQRMHETIITDVLGKQVYDKAYTKQLDISTLCNGVYLITVIDEAGNIYRQKIIKE